MSWYDESLEVSVPAESANTLGVVFSGASYGEVTADVLDESASAYGRGLRVGDTVNSINGIRPYSAEHARSILERRSVFGDIHKLKVIRRGMRHSLETPLIIACVLVLAYLGYLFGPSLGRRGEHGDQLEL
jgi:hypothetical protein